MTEESEQLFEYRPNLPPMCRVAAVAHGVLAQLTGSLATLYLALSAAHVLMPCVLAINSIVCLHNAYMSWKLARFFACRPYVRLDNRGIVVPAPIERKTRTIEWVRIADVQMRRRRIRIIDNDGKRTYLHLGLCIRTKREQLRDAVLRGFEASQGQSR